MARTSRNVSAVRVSATMIVVAARMTAASEKRSKWSPIRMPTEPIAQVAGTIRIDQPSMRGGGVSDRCWKAAVAISTTPDM